MLLKEQIKAGINTFFIPHHIGYKQGYRGINWDTFDEELSPFVEIISMHGCAESDFSPALPYLHTMGPKDHENTMSGGLLKDKFFGVCGSTDHHSAHPGSYGYGRIAVIAKELTRESLFEAMKNRRVYALTGDRIKLDVKLNGFPIGSRIKNNPKRDFDISIEGGDALDYVEIIKNGKPAKRFNYIKRDDHFSKGEMKRGKIFVEVGWGEKGKLEDWDFNLIVKEGTLLNIEPRFHGVDVVDPLEKHERAYQFSSWEELGDRGLHCITATYGNPTSQTSATEGFCLEVEGSDETQIQFKMGDYSFSKPLGELIEGSLTSYLGGFLTGAVRFARFVPENEYKIDLKWSNDGPGNNGDFYYVRVCQRNNQWAWSSPFKMIETET